MPGKHLSGHREREPDEGGPGRIRRGPEQSAGQTCETSGASGEWVGNGSKPKWLWRERRVRTSISSPGQLGAPRRLKRAGSSGPGHERTKSRGNELGRIDRRPGWRKKGATGGIHGWSDSRLFSQGGSRRSQRDPARFSGRSGTRGTSRPTQDDVLSRQPVEKFDPGVLVDIQDFPSSERRPDSGFDLHPVEPQ